MDEPLRDGLDAGQQPEQLDGLRKPPPAPLPPPQQLDGLRVHLRRVGSQTGVVVRCARTHAALLRQATAVLGMETAAERCFVASGDELGPEGFALIEPQETLYFCGGGEGWRPPRGHAAAAAAPAPTEARSLTNRSEMCDADRWHGMTKEASGPWHLLKRHCAALRSLFSGHFIVDQWVGNADLYASIGGSNRGLALPSLGLQLHAPGSRTGAGPTCSRTWSTSTPTSRRSRRSSSQASRPRC